MHPPDKSYKKAPHSNVNDTFILRKFSSDPLTLLSLTVFSHRSQLTSKLKRIEQTRSRISAVESLLVEAESSVSEHSRFVRSLLLPTHTPSFLALTPFLTQ